MTEPQGIDEVLDTVELLDRAKDKVGGYSHGMRQRLGIAASLLRQPKLLLLDEPTTGLDPAGMRDMRELVHRLAGQGMTVMLSSHLMSEVQELCNRVAIIQRGKVIRESSLEELLASAVDRYRLEVTDREQALRVIAAERGVHDIVEHEGSLMFAADHGSVAQLTIALGQTGIGIRALVPESSSLEQVFFALTESADESVHDVAPTERLAS